MNEEPRKAQLGEILEALELGIGSIREIAESILDKINGPTVRKNDEKLQAAGIFNQTELINKKEQNI